MSIYHSVLPILFSIDAPVKAALHGKRAKGFACVNQANLSKLRILHGFLDIQQFCCSFATTLHHFHLSSKYIKMLLPDCKEERYMWAENMVSRRRNSKPFMMAFFCFLTPPGFNTAKTGSFSIKLQRTRPSKPPKPSQAARTSFASRDQQQQGWGGLASTWLDMAGWAAARPGRQARNDYNYSILGLY